MTEHLLVTVDNGDAEPTIVQTTDHAVVVSLHDGRRIQFDRRELTAALDDNHKQAA